MSLRDNATNTLQLMATAFNRLPYGKDLLNGPFSQLLATALRSRSTTARNEAVVLLSHAVTRCDALSPHLASLQRLGHSKKESLDFFQNIRHVQSNKQTQALQKYVTL